MRHTWVTNPLHILYTRASKNLNFVEFRVFAGTPSKNAAIYRGFRTTVLYTAYYCTTSEKNSGIGLSTSELFTFKHARAYCYACFGRFSRVHAHLQTRKWSELYRLFSLLDYRPLKVIYGLYLRGSWWPEFFVQGGLKDGKIAFSGESSAF